jgi:DNA-directed RNA polymerase subunit M/transcription elongation factor TFIIS
MKFCSKCDNMYYIAIAEDNENKLSYYCRICGNKENSYSEETCVLSTNNTSGEQIYNYTINEYTKHDPTLPRIHNMECPNLDCKTNETNTSDKKKPAEIVYIRYDDNNLKYTYICVECDYVWKTNTL